MSELDDLPSWAGRSTEEVQLPDGPPEKAPITENSVPEPPALPKEPEPEASEPEEAEPEAGQPEIAAATAAAQAPPVEAVPVEAPPVEAPPVASASPLADVDETTAAPAVTAKPEAPRKRSRLRLLLLGLLGLAVLAGAAAIGYSLATSDSDATEASGTAASDDTEATDDQADAAVDAESGSDADATADDDGAVATDTDTTDADDADADAASEGDGGSETVTVEVDPEGDAEATDGADGEAALNDGDRQAIFRDGKVYLIGAVPSEEIGEQIVAKAEAVVGPGNVINEYEIDPSTTIEPGSSAPLYVEDVILFEFNSIEIATPFLPILDLGTLLLRQNPQASVTVVTRTDAVGSEEVNLEVARRRAQAVINYWLGQGVDPDQILADPRGEEGASDDDDAETAALQRRAEFIITGLLD